MDASNTTNPLLSSHNNSDSQLQIQLHPLVILTVSDYVTRHTLRRQKGAIVGAILGAQNGRDITLEHAFECKVIETNDHRVLLDDDWFRDRLQQHKDVHKSPQLDLVGWFTLTPPSGPQPIHIPIHQQLLDNYNESALLLAFHSGPLLDGSRKGSQLPITVYETAFEAGPEGDDKHMQASDEGPQLVLRFRELPYTIETGETEMIGVDFVAKGAANATATNGVSAAKEQSTIKAATRTQVKGKAHAEEEPGLDLDILSPEDEELIASLTTKANAIRMLQQRISLTNAYVSSIPPCYLNTQQSETEPVVATSHPQISHPILRSISATLSRLPLLTPLSTEATPLNTSRHPSSFAQESAQQKSDVALVSLLGSLGTTLRSAQDMGKKAAIVERARSQAAQMQSGFAAKSRGGGSYPLRSGGGEDFGGFGEAAAYTPPTEFEAGDEGYVDDYDDEAFAGGGSASGGISLRTGRGDDFAADALRGKGKGVLRGRPRNEDEDEEMT